MSARIPLRASDGAVRAWTVVDDADFAMVSAWRWYLGSRGHAERDCGDRNGERQLERMSRRLLSLALGDPLEVDHIDRDKLNNQRANLRVVTRAANCQNVSSRKGSTSQYRGVYFDRPSGQWRAAAQLDRHKYHLGYFRDEHEAGAAVAEWRRENMPYSKEAMAA